MPSLRLLRRLSLLQRFAALSLLVFVVLGFGLAYALGQSITSATLADARQDAVDDLHARLLSHLTPADLHMPMRGERYQRFESFVEHTILSGRTVRVKVWNTRGTVIFSTDPHIVGRTFPIEEELETALHGGLASEVSSLGAAENEDDRPFGQLLSVYIPIQFRHGGPIVGSFEIYRRYAPVAHRIADLQRTTYELLGGGLFVLYVVLFGVFRNGSRTIAAQQRRIVENSRQLEESYKHTIAALASAVDARDSSTETHSERVTALALALGKWLGLDDQQMRSLERGALLHDVGKIGVRDAVLRKPGKLTDAEWVEMRRHPQIGFTMLRHVPFLGRALPVVLFHHERWDGTGYPMALRGEAIPFTARLFAVIDTYDALTSDRPYRAALSHDAAMEVLREESGTHFDPAMVEAFGAMMRANRLNMPSEVDGAAPDARDRPVERAAS